MEKFRKLGLGEQILGSIKEAGFESPMEIQEKAIPLALAGRDIIGGSATGSGKTLAFGASIIEKSSLKGGVQALILTPTRELCEQVAEALAWFSSKKGLRVVAVYGGVSIGPQVSDIEEAEIVVGTPGRILDHLERGTLKLVKVKTLVLDEADRMLDMGFIDDVERIIGQCPKDRQTFLFSATISQDIEHIAGKYMRNPVDIHGEEMVDPSKLKQVYYDTPSNLKFSLLVHLLKNEKSKLVMVFCNTRMNADFISSNLKRYEINAVAIHGGLAQNKRSRIMEKFKSSELQVLICTDVAARGLDIPGVSHVYNYDSSKTSDEYIHRIGRTARAGKEGIAISIVAERDYDNFRRVLGNGALKIERIEVPENLEQVQISFAGSRAGFRGREGFRGGRFGGGRFGGGNRFSGRERSGSYGGGRGGGRERFGGRGSGGFVGRREGGSGRREGARRFVGMGRR